MEHEIKLPEGLTHEGLEVGTPKGKPIDPAKLGYLITFIKTYFQPRGTISHYHGSYALKHLVERCFDNKIYVSNGELIAAMLICGYEYVKINPNYKNCRFNVCRISKKKEKAIADEIAYKNKKKKHGKSFIKF